MHQFDGGAADPAHFPTTSCTMRITLLIGAAAATTAGATQFTASSPPTCHVTAQGRTTVHYSSVSRARACTPSVPDA